jgi:hypothetical protein
MTRQPGSLSAAAKRKHPNQPGDHVEGSHDFPDPFRRHFEIWDVDILLTIFWSIRHKINPTPVHRLIINAA